MNCIKWEMNCPIPDEQIIKQCHCPPHINDGTLTDLHNELY